MASVDEVKTLKVPELKEKLKELGLDVKGVKADLVKRLEDALKAQQSGPAAPEKDATVETTKPSNAIPKPTGATIPATKTSTPAADPVPAKPIDGLSESEKRQQRAERFGVEPAAKDKLKARAERFGTATNGSSNGKASNGKAGIAKVPEADKEADLEKRKERAKRFNLPVPSSAPEEAEKKKARLARFGGGTSDLATSGSDLQKKLAERAERFALGSKPDAAKPASPAPEKPAAELSAAEAKRQARLIRFAPT